MADFRGGPVPGARAIRRGARLLELVMTDQLSPRAIKRLGRLLSALDRALSQMDGSVEVNELVNAWRGSANIRENIAEFVDWQRRKLSS